jgi:hypothetical protein
LNRPRPTQGCRVNRRRRIFPLHIRSSQSKSYGYPFHNCLSRCPSKLAKCPNHAILLQVVSLAIFFPFLNLSSSSIGSIHHDPSACLFAPHIYSAVFRGEKLNMILLTLTFGTDILPCSLLLYLYCQNNPLPLNLIYSFIICYDTILKYL